MALTREQEAYLASVADKGLTDQAAEQARIAAAMVDSAAAEVRAALIPRVQQVKQQEADALVAQFDVDPTKAAAVAASVGLSLTLDMPSRLEELHKGTSVAEWLQQNHPLANTLLSKGVTVLSTDQLDAAKADAKAAEDAIVKAWSPSNLRVISTVTALKAQPDLIDARVKVLADQAAAALAVGPMKIGG